MIAPPPVTGISGPHAAPNVCAPTIVEALSMTPSSDPLVRIAVGRDGGVALVSTVRREEGGMYVFRRADGKWCRLAGGGGVMGEADLAAVDGIGAAEARRLFARLSASKAHDVR